jgi:hypothetical protein
MKNSNGGATKPKKKIQWKALSNPTLFKFKDTILHSTKGGGNSVHLPSTMVDDVDYSLEIPISTTSAFFPIMQEGTSTITSLISKYNVLPSGICNYKDDKSKEGVEGFIFMDYINKFELHLLETVDNNPKLKNSIYAKAGIDFRKYDPKIKIIESGLFVSSITQPLHKDEDLAGQDDTSKSPIMSTKIWTADPKTDMRTGELNMNVGIAIKDQKTLIYTTVRIQDVQEGKVAFPIIKTWEQFESCCVYYKDSSKNGGPAFFNLLLGSELLAPSLFFNKTEIRFQWKFKLITIYEKQEISRQLGRTPEEDAEEYKAYLNYNSKYTKSTNSQDMLAIMAPTATQTTNNNNNNVDENYQEGHQPEELPPTQDPTVVEQQEKHETDNEENNNVGPADKNSETNAGQQVKGLKRKREEPMIASTAANSNNNNNNNNFSGSGSVQPSPKKLKSKQ